MMLEGRKEIEEQHQKGAVILKELERLLKEQEVNFDTHTARISWLQFLLNSINELRHFKLEAIDLESQKSKEVLDLP